MEVARLPVDERLEVLNSVCPEAAHSLTVWLLSVSRVLSRFLFWIPGFRRSSILDP